MIIELNFKELSPKKHKICDKLGYNRLGRKNFEKEVVNK